METIGKWWLAPHESLENEKIVWSCFANRTQSMNRAVGGVLYLTNKRMLFSPHRFDYFLGGQKWAAELSEVSDIGSQGKGGSTFGGGLRDRLMITLADGRIELFVVNKLDQVINNLRGNLAK